MKNILLLFLAFLGFTLMAQAQEISKSAAGLRLSGNDGFGTEITYQHRLTPRSRVESDLGLILNTDFTAVKFTGLYQRVYEISNGFNWYAGVGAGVGFVANDDIVITANGNSNRIEGDNFAYFYLSGNGGVEYHFEFPLLVSLDFRPEVGFNDKVDKTLNFSLGLSTRYKF